MSKKYHKDNYYKDCTTMMSYEDALKVDMNKNNIKEITMKVKMFEQFFGNPNDSDAILQEDFKLRRKEIINTMTDEEKKTMAEEYKNEIAEYSEKAKKEYEERVAEADLESVEEASSSAPMIEITMDEEDEQNTTHFTQLHNYIISDEFVCNDQGVFRRDRKTEVLICAPISIADIAFDEDTRIEYIQLEYIDQNLNKKVEISISAELVSKQDFNALSKTGFILNNAKGLMNYINDIKNNDVGNNKIQKKKSALKYGFPFNNNKYNFENFVGINPVIMPMEQYRDLDNKIFKSNGTLEEQIEFWDYVSKGKYKNVFKMFMAVGLCSILIPFSATNPPVYVFFGKTSIGKSLAASLIAGLYGYNGNINNGMISSASASTAYQINVKSRLNNLPYIIADIQNNLNKDKNYLSIMAYEHSDGVAGERCTGDGGIRTGENGKKTWKSAGILFAENRHKDALSGGGDARIVFIDMLADDRITENALNTYAEKNEKNYGHIGKIFIEKLMEYYKEGNDLRNMIIECSNKFVSAGVQTKQADSYAILLVAYQLAQQFELLPESWEAMDEDALIDIIGISEVKDPVLQMYDILSENVRKDSSFPDVNENILEQSYKNRSKTPEQVHGRLGKKLINGKTRMVLYIPKNDLEAQFRYYSETFEIIGFSFDQKKWFENGWLLRNTDGYLFRKSNITRPLDKSKREKVYTIILKEDDDDDSDKAA